MGLKRLIIWGVGRNFRDHLNIIKQQENDGYFAVGATAKRLLSHNVRVNGIIVTGASLDPDSVCGIPVLHLDEVDVKADDMVIIAVARYKKTNIQHMRKEKRIKRIIPLMHLDG